MARRHEKGRTLSMSCLVCILILLFSRAELFRSELSITISSDSFSNSVKSCCCPMLVTFNLIDTDTINANLTKRNQSYFFYNSSALTNHFELTHALSESLNMRFSSQIKLLPLHSSYNLSIACFKNSTVFS